MVYSYNTIWHALCLKYLILIVCTSECKQICVFGVPFFLSMGQQLAIPTGFENHNKEFSSPPWYKTTGYQLSWCRYNDSLNVDFKVISNCSNTLLLFTRDNSETRKRIHRFTFFSCVICRFDPNQSPLDFLYRQLFLRLFIMSPTFIRVFIRMDHFI